MNSKKLGKIVSKHPVGKLGLLYLIIGIALIISLIPLIYIESTIEEKNLSAFIYIIASVFFLMGINIVFKWFKYKDSYINVFENGFVFFRSKKTRVYLWSQIKYISQRTERARINGVNGPTNTTVRIKAKSGGNYKLTNNIYAQTQKTCAQSTTVHVSTANSQKYQRY